MAYKLLVIEDDNRMREIINDYFTVKGFQVFEAADGAEALERLDESEYDIAFLDIMMPHIDGFTVCRAIRRKSNMPVIFLTARSREDDMLFGYELGADDYITKPFSLPVLHAKTLALIKRGKNATDEVYEFDGLSVNTKNRKVVVDSRAIDLAPKEYELLLYLIKNKDSVLSREQILNAVWGYDYFGGDRAVDTHIKKLRAGLGKQSWRVKTVIKAGYQFDGGKKH
ncbi:MAG: response regulator transcription factor [Clostridiales bacterium]|jgi:DNA-binding response OmpR family regulator|nr:response regulator transcription factor [Clostridiales bacterium]